MAAAALLWLAELRGTTQPGCCMIQRCGPLQDDVVAASARSRTRCRLKPPRWPHPARPPVTVGRKSAYKSAECQRAGASPASDPPRAAGDAAGAAAPKNRAGGRVIMSATMARVKLPGRS